MSNQTDNLKLWSAVREPDRAFTKVVNMRGGFTSVSPQYIIQLATQHLGPYGAGFGLATSEFNYSLLESHRVAIHTATFFYNFNGERHDFPITNSIEVVTRNGHVDTDYAKKAETNTLCKALSKIGFAADVYMGMFEDANYVEEITNKQSIEKASDKDAERARQAQELSAEVDKVIAQIGSSRSLSELEGLYKSLARKLQNKEPKFLIKLTKAKDEAKQKLESEE
jgi:hypothetical protein